MAENKEVYNTINDAVNKACAEKIRFIKGEKLTLPDGTVVDRRVAQIAVALLQLSLRYFVATKAPKAVVLDFIFNLMGIEGERAKLEELPGGRLRIVPPNPNIVIADARKDEEKKNGGN